MAEERTEDPNVVAAAIARANHHLVGGLVREAQSRGEIDAVLHVAAETGTAEADSAYLARIEVQETGVAGLVDRLRIDNVQAQAVVDGQLRRQAPGVLPVIEMTPLPFTGVRAGTDVTPEARNVAEQECG